MSPESSASSGDAVKFAEPAAGDVVTVDDGTRFEFDGSTWRETPESLRRKKLAPLKKLASLKKERDDILSADIDAINRGEELQADGKYEALLEKIAQLKGALGLAGGRRRRRTRKGKRKPKKKTRGRRRRRKGTRKKT